MALKIPSPTLVSTTFIGKTTAAAFIPYTKGERRPVNWHNNLALNPPRGLHMKDIPLLINGEFIPSKSTDRHDILNPATQEKLATLPYATNDEMLSAVAAAKEAFKTWREVAVPERARVMLRYQD